MSFRHTVNNLARIRRILEVLFKYGFGYFVERLHIDRGTLGRNLLRLRRLRRAELLELSDAARLRLALEELGPTFIKLGQILSMRPDLVSREIAAGLEELQDRVPGFSHALAEREVEAELKKPLAEVFSSFSHVPLAAASLAQVHEARLLNGQDVIVKVQRPRIARTIGSDIEILYWLAHLAERYIPESRIFDPVGIVDEFRNTVSRELDFLNEGFNVERFTGMFRGDRTVRIPKLYRDLTTKRVIVLEKIDGIKINDIPAIEGAGLDRKQIAHNGADAVLKMIFPHGFFHADPHPGNILVQADNVVVFLDFGMVGRLSGPVKEHLTGIFVNLVRHDIPAMRDAFLSVGRAEREVDVQALDQELEDFVERYYGRPLRELHIGEVMLNLFHLVARHRIHLPPDLFLLSKALMEIEGIGLALDPEFNLVEQARPFAEEMQRRRNSPRAMARELRGFARALARMLRAFPRDLSVIFGKLKNGTLQVEFEHRGLEELTLQIDKASSRIAFSLITAALLVGSSIIMHMNRGPEYFGVPVLGLAIFVVAVIMAIWLAIVIVSSGRL